MRLEIALGAIVAAETLSPSVASAHGTRPGLQEAARFRKDVIEAMSKGDRSGNQEYRHSHRFLGQRQRNRRILRQRREVFQDRLRDVVEDRIKQLSEATKNQLPGVPTQQHKEDIASKDPPSSSGFPDLGILTSTQSGKEERKSPREGIRQILSTIQSQRLKIKSISGDNDHNTIPDLGILSSTSTNGKINSIKDKVRKFPGLMNRKSQSIHPDLGILSSLTSNERRSAETELDSEPSGSEKDHRRLEDLDFEDVLDEIDLGSVISSPYASMVNLYCNIMGQFCDTCVVSDVEESEPYDIKMDCPNIPEEYSGEASTLFTNLGQVCENCDECDVDAENFKAELQGCKYDLPDGLDGIFNDEVLDGIFNDEYLGDTNGSLEDVFNSALSSNVLGSPIATGGYALCHASIKTLEMVTGQGPFCTVCQVTDLNDQIIDLSDPESELPDGAYNLQINCPDIPEGSKGDFYEAFKGFSSLCDLNVCQTCVVDAENSLIDMQDCESILPDGMESIFDSIGDGNTGDGNTGEYGNAESNLDSSFENILALQGIEAYFNAYFQSLCATDEEIEELSCNACGKKASNETASFAFEIDCPSKLSASNNGFGAYMAFAESFCYCPDEFGIQCSTCEVNPFEATINIEGCVPITGDAGESSSCSFSESEDINLSPQLVFIAQYKQLCNPETALTLQDSIMTPVCDCAFDESTQTASVICQDKESCRQISSYCEDALDFCEIERTEMSFTKDGTLSLKRCVDFSSPYEFSYCVDLEGTDEGSPGCEMEVDGIQCNSCSVFNKNGDEMMAFGSLDDMDILYNCTNTVIGANGPGNLSTYSLVDDTLSYFIYQSLPCSGGCDLCGSGDLDDESNDPKTEFMTNPDGEFSSEFWNDGKKGRCFDAQLEAMSGNKKLTNKECQGMRDSARETCGCKNPNPQSGAHSFFMRTATAEVLLLTMAAASIFQMIFG